MWITDTFPSFVLAFKELGKHSRFERTIVYNIKLLFVRTFVGQVWNPANKLSCSFIPENHKPWSHTVDWLLRKLNFVPFGSNIISCHLACCLVLLDADDLHGVVLQRRCIPGAVHARTGIWTQSHHHCDQEGGCGGRGPSPQSLGHHRPSPGQPPAAGTGPLGAVQDHRPRPEPGQSRPGNFLNKCSCNLIFIQSVSKVFKVFPNPPQDAKYSCVSSAPNFIVFAIFSVNRA